MALTTTYMNFKNFKFKRKKTNLEGITLEAYKNASNSFTTLSICNYVANEGYNYLESTIMRTLRGLRQRNIISYKCVDSYRSEYVKK